MSAVPSLARTRGKHFQANPPLDAELNGSGQRHALELFRQGFDSVQIASELHCTPAAAANAIARSR